MRAARSGSTWSASGRSRPGRRRSSTCAGRSEMGYARVRAVGLVGLTATRSRSRPTSPAGCPASCFRPARRLAERGPRPGPGGGGQLRRGVAAAADHGEPAPGRPAQARLRLRPRHRRRRARPAPATLPLGRARAAPRSSANSAWTARSGRCAGCCRWCSPRPGPGIRRVVVPAAQRRRGRPRARTSTVRGARRRCASSSSSCAAACRCPTRRRPTTPTTTAGPDLADVVGQERGRLRPGARRRRPAPPRAVRAARRGQDHAGPAPAVDPAAAGRRRRAGGHRLHSIAGALPAGAAR